MIGLQIERGTLSRAGLAMAALILLLAGFTAPLTLGASAQSGPSVSVSPDSGPAGASVTVSGSGWTSSLPEYRIFWDAVGGTQLGSFSPSGGSWSTSVTIPGGASPGGYTIWACQGYGGEFQECASTGFTVVAADTPTPSLTFTPSATFTPSVTPSPTLTPTPTLAECIDEINILVPGINEDGSWVDLGGVETVDMEVEVIYGREEPPEVLFFANDRYDPYTRWPDPEPGTTVDVEMDPGDPYRYLFTVEDVPLGRGYNELKVEVPGTCRSSDVEYRQFNNGVPFTPTPRPDECGGLGLGPEAELIQFDSTTTTRLREQAREDYGVLFGTSFEVYEPDEVLPRSADFVGASSYDIEFGSQLRPIHMTFLRPLQAVGTFVGLDSAHYVASEVTASMTVYGYRAGAGELVRLGAASTSFPPEPSDVVHCLLFEAEEGDLITKAVLEYSDAAGTSMAERRIMDDLTLVFSDEEEVPDQPPQVTIDRPEAGTVIDSPDLVSRADILEDRELVRVEYRLNDGPWREVGASPLADDPTAFFSAAALPHEDLRLLADNTLSYRAEDGAGQTGEDSVTFRYEPEEPFAFHDMRFRFSQHGPFDVSGFPDRMIAHKSSALRVTGLPQFGGRVGPVAIDEAGLTVRWLFGEERHYRAFRRTGSGFAPGGPFEGEAGIYFFLDGDEVSAGPAIFELSLTIGEEVVYRRALGMGAFRISSPQYVYAVPFVDPLRGQYALDFYTEIMNMARVYPVRDGAAPFGSPLAEAGEAGLIYQVSPSHVPMPNGTSPYLPIDSYSWDLIQDEADERMRLATEKGTPIDCNGDGEIDEDDEVTWLKQPPEGAGATYWVDSNEPRGSLQWNWGAPEDADGDGVIRNDDLAKFVVEFYDLDGDEAWHDFEGDARARFNPGDPYHTYKDENRNCELDGDEKSSLALGAQRKDNAWNYMRSIAEYRMEQFADAHGLPRMATVAILPGERMTTFKVVGNCGDSGVCWAGTGMGMAIAHELGHGWGLDHASPRRIQDGAVNLAERAWIEEGSSRNFIFKSVGNQPRENFASAERFFQLMDQADNGWDYFNLAALEAGGAGLAALRQPPEPPTGLVLSLYGSLTLDDEVRIDDVFVRPGSPPAEPDPGDFELVLLDESGDELASYAFAVVTESVCDGCPHGEETVAYEQPYFSVRVPFIEAAQRIQIRRGGETLASIERSVYAPSVEWLAAPSGQVDRERTLRPRWQAEDRDDDDLTYRLEYSADGGETFTSIAQDLSQTTFDWSPDLEPGSDEARLRVVASDGFNQVAATTDPFALSGAAPSLNILSPQPDSQYVDEAVLMLAAAAIDPEDGPLDGDSVVWTDAQGEDVGRGARAMLQGLELGEHTFTVVARDSDENEVQASVSVEVVEAPPPAAVRVLRMVDVESSEAVLAAGACESSQARLTADFPTGMGAERVRAVVNGAGLPREALAMDPQDDGTFAATLRVEQSDPEGAWEFAVVVQTASGEVWSHPTSFEVVECPEEQAEAEGIGAARRLLRPLVLGVVAVVLFALAAAGGYLIYRRRSAEPAQE